MAIDALQKEVRKTTQRIMLVVLLALLPGTLAMTNLWGLGVLWNILWLLAFCLLTEILCCGRDWHKARRQIANLSACVTAALIAICLPPEMPLYVLFTASVVAVGLAKAAYGGLGRNIFNPAMVGFAVAFVSFPAAFTSWPLLDGLVASTVDVLSGATQLSEFRYRDGVTVAEFDSRYGELLSAQTLVASCFAVGGIMLVACSIITWHIPAGCLLGLALASLFGYDQGSSLSAGSITFHLFSGGFVVAMFFVATDPVTHPRQRSAQVFFGAMIGLLTYLIRAHGIYPDGIAFAILLANCATPLLDRLTSKAKNSQQKHA